MGAPNLLTRPPMPAAATDPTNINDLLTRAAAGETRALTKLYDVYGNDVYAVALRLMGERQDAEDIVQDVFVRLPEAIRAYDARGAFGAWLRRVAARAALMSLRARSRRRESRDDDREWPSRTPDVLDRIAVEDALAALSPTLRVVVVLKELEGYSHGEIASMLGISRRASEVRLHRATIELRRLLDDMPRDVGRRRE